MRLSQRKYNFNPGSLRPATFFKALIRAGIGMMPDSTRKRLLESEALMGYYVELRNHYRHIKSYIKPQKAARVFIRRGIERMEFFQILNERGIDYVLLRWWENLPQIPEGEDMDILIRDSQRHLINDLVTFRDNGTGLKCDIYTISGSNYGSHNNIPYFQSNLAHTLIKTRVPYMGAYVPSPKLYFASLAYHALFHKGCGSGLKGFDGLGTTPKDLEHDYSVVLKNQAARLNSEVEIDVKGIFDWLKKEQFIPAEDTLSKLAEVKPELSFLQKRLFSDIRGGEFLVYVVRERLLQDGFLQDFSNFLEKEFQFDILDVRALTPEEKRICSTQIRGGKWDKGPFKYSGGEPVALVSAYDFSPEPLGIKEIEKQPRMTNRHNMLAKYKYRERLHNLVKSNGHYNGVHSADNEHDAWFYVSLLGENYQNDIMNEVEKRRKSFARRWNLDKTLCKGANSKVEVIKYKGGLAVKKTFKPGKERFLERELFAARDLSKEVDFIPPLLEEGDGFIVVPYFDNILSVLKETSKLEALSSRTTEIAKIIHCMYSRGLALINFSPENLLVTPQGKLYCTEFSYLQAYSQKPQNIQKAYEVAGVPVDFGGDFPDSGIAEPIFFKKVWGSLSSPLQKKIISLEKAPSVK